MSENIIFQLHYHLSDDSTLDIDAIHTGQFDDRGTSKITIRATHTRWKAQDSSDNKGRVIEIWSPGQTWCNPSPMHADDSNEVKSLVTSLVSIKPGDTDSGYFSNYTPEQLAFCQSYGEEIECLRYTEYGEL